MSARRDLLSRDQAAKFLGVSTGWLAAHVDDGPTVTRLGRDFYYLQTDLEAYLKGRRDAIAGGVAKADAAARVMAAPTAMPVKQAPPAARGSTNKPRPVSAKKVTQSFAQTTQLIGAEMMRNLVQSSRKTVGAPPPLPKSAAPRSPPVAVQRRSPA